MTHVDLDPNIIHLCVTPFTDLTDPALLRQYETLLSDEERERRGGYLFEIDQRRYLVARALLRTVLSRYAPIEPRDWVFAANEYGRPAIAQPIGQTARLRFNISHTRRLILLGVTADRQLGVDIEDWHARQAPLAIADHFFALQEVRDLRALPHVEQHRRFFEYWTLKESYIKARGKGLAIPLDRFSFRFPSPTSISLAVNPDLNDQARCWRFWQFEPMPGSVAAVCAERPGTGVPRLLLKQIIPLVEESDIEHHPMRKSLD